MAKVLTSPNKSPLAASHTTMKEFTLEEVVQSRGTEVCWIIIRGNVYDVTNWLDEHPGGEEILQVVAGPSF